MCATPLSDATPRIVAHPFETLRSGWVGATMVLAVGHRSPSNPDWNAWVDAYCAVALRHSVRRLLVVSHGGGPSARQIKHEIGVLAEFFGTATAEFRTACCSDSPLARAVTKTFGWLAGIPNIRAFARDELAEALDFLDVPPNARASLGSMVRAFSAELSSSRRGRGASRRPTSIQLADTPLVWRPPAPPSQPVDPNLGDGWRCALEVAERADAVTHWQRLLSESVLAAVTPDAVGVFLCTLGNALEATWAISPRECSSFGEALIDCLGRAYKAGLETPSDLMAPLSGPHPPALASLVAGSLQPAGFRGLVGEFLRAPDGMLAGWIVVFTREDAARRGPVIRPALRRVSQVASSTLGRSLSLAAAVGGRFPRISSAPLSQRELAIARCAAQGLSNLNIALELSISDGTVSRHLHNVYRKLGVSSRLELLELLGTGSDAPVRGPSATSRAPRSPGDP